jgi:chaperone modulatory protein CbpM
MARTTSIAIMVIDEYGEQGSLTLGELCRACGVHAEYVIELVAEGVLEPVTGEFARPERWRFACTQIRQTRTAVRLQRDLGVNAAGVAVALQLIDELETLRARLRAAGAE